jgi:hypothetical protein
MLMTQSGEFIYFPGGGAGAPTALSNVGFPPHLIGLTRRHLLMESKGR